MVKIIEKWRAVVNYEGFYDVSNHGRIRSCKKDKLLKIYYPKNGYGQVSLLKHGERKNGRIHRLVAEAFIKTDNLNLYVNHIDGNKHNNLFTNLEWLSPQDNILHAFKKELNFNGKGEEARNVKLKEKDVVYIRQNFKKEIKKDLAEMFNVSISCIEKIVLRKTWKHITEE